MKRLFAIFLAAFSFLALGAQEQADTLETVSPVDSLLVGRDILMVIGENVSVNQSEEIRAAIDRYIAENAEKPVQGYRIRVFYDNSPQARTRSEGIESSLRAQLPGTGVYRSFESPNYKVAVGDFRTRDDALKVFMALKATYPTAYIIKESINYQIG